MVSKASDRAQQQLDDLARSIHEVRVKMMARRLKVSATVAATIIDPKRPHTIQSTSPWARLPQGFRRVCKRVCDPPRQGRPTKTSERIFREAPTPTPAWYFDASLPLPAALQSLVNR